MMKDVVITIKSIQNYGFAEEETLEFTSDGYYMAEDNTVCINYTESEVTGLEGTRTSIVVMPDKVAVDRDGLITSRMIFAEGEKTQFQYNTPYGAATLGIDTRKIERNFDENGGELELVYVLDMEHAVVTKNKFHITVKQMGENTNG